VGKEFANDYYSHYPKIGLGVWPPFFYAVQSTWTLPFNASRTTLLLLMAALAGGLGWVVFHALRDEYGIAGAAPGAVLVLSLPLVRTQYGMVMAETLSALLMSGAILCFGNFLDRERRGDALWFGVLAALAILTKGTGLALVIAAPLALLLTRKFSLLKRPVLWGAVLIVLTVAGPWTWATRHLGKGGWLQPEPSWSFVREALPYYAGKMALALGFAALLPLGLGLVAKMRVTTRNHGRWSAVTALIIAVVIFQSIAPVGLEARHIIPALPAAGMLVVAGLYFVSELLQKKRAGHTETPAANSCRWRDLFCWFAAILLFGWSWLSTARSQKGFSGFGSLAQVVVTEAAPAEVTLVSSDVTGEGVFISEVALRERRPGHVIQRASKSLASSTWSGSGYSPAFTRDEDALAFLTSGVIRYLVLDAAVPREKRREHHAQLERLVESHADRFQLIAEAEYWRGGVQQPTALKLYQISRKN